MFCEATEALTADFEAGWTRVWTQLTTGEAQPQYHGSNHRAAHVVADPRLDGGPALVRINEAYAEAKARRGS